MMRSILSGCLMGVLALPLTLGLASASDADEKTEPQWKADARNQLDKAYPEPEDGMVRYVLYLEPKADEDSLRVEILAGKTIETDGVNHYGFGGQVKSNTIKGWGYTMHTVDKAAYDYAFSSRRAVPEGTPKVKRFVGLKGGPHMVRYNSKLPVVVYVPAEGEVRYRIWQAPPKATPMLPG